MHIVQPKPAPEDELGEAPTIPASMVESEVPAAPVAPVVDQSDRLRVFSALFDTPAGEARLGRYVVRGTLGSGGMGTVLKAVDPELDRKVALKVLHRELEQRHTVRLRREAKALAKLSHPNVVQVYEVGEIDGQTFVAMELVKGLTLREWMRREPKPSWQECVEVFLQVGEGLAAAHEQGLIHRDFKPANAIIDRKGRVRVLDFGLARRLDDISENDSSKLLSPEEEPLNAAAMNDALTRTGAILGTPAYMPPEQMRGEDTDARSDQFSFCVSLYEAVYGERPFDGKTLGALVKSTTRGDVRPAPRGVRLPSKLRRILLRGLAVKPDERWSSMDSLLVELRGVLAPRRRPWFAMGLVGALSIVGLGLWRYAEAGAPAAVGAAVDDTLTNSSPGTAASKDAPNDDVTAAAPGANSVRRGPTVPLANPTERPQESVAAGTVENVDDAVEKSDKSDLGSGAMQSPPPKPKRRKNDASRRKQLAKKLGKCGESGAIEITAEYVLESGALLEPQVIVRGPASKVPYVRICAESAIASFKLGRRKEPSLFTPLKVEL